MKKQLYDIHASFLVPAYNLPDGTKSWYIATQEGHHSNGSICIDVWLVNASRDNPTDSMLESLTAEENDYQTKLEEAEAEEKSDTNDRKIRELKHGLNVFANLISMANDTVYHKQPDEKFLNIAKCNFTMHEFAKCQPDLTNYLYLAALSGYQEM